MEKPKLRSNFTPGPSLWAVRRAQWKALGLSDEDMEKPEIAVAETVKQSIREARGLSFEIRTTAPSDFIFWTPPAHLMAAARLNLPTILMVCGYQPSGEYRGRPMDIDAEVAHNLSTAAALRGGRTEGWLRFAWSPVVSV